MKGGGGADFDFRHHAAWARPARIAATMTTSAIPQRRRQLRTNRAMFHQFEVYELFSHLPVPNL